MSYAPDAADALVDIADAGAAASFVSTLPGALDPTTETYSGGSTSTMTGSAVEVPGKGDRYEALSLVHQDVKMLIFAPTNYGDRPPLRANITWAGASYSVEVSEPVAPDGNAILSRVTIVR